jgi:hypothetical protein
MRRCLYAILLLALAAAAGAACSPKDAAPRRASPEGTLAVAGFTNPRFNWELLAGYLPEQGHQVEHETVTKLTTSLVSTLQKHEVTDFIPPRITRQCQEIVVFETVDATREAAFRYWLKVGACLKADFLLLPQILYFEERQGGKWASRSPASVVFDLFLINVKDKTIAGRYHFEETQQALTENMLEAGKFFKRGGKWINGLELAEEGLNEGLRELGL